jgi:hypothetical protein
VSTGRYEINRNQVYIEVGFAHRLTVSEWKKAPCCLQIRATDSSGGSGFIVDVHQRDQSGLEVRQQFYQMREVDFAIGFDVYKKDRNSKFVL